MNPLLAKLQYKGQAEVHVLSAPPELDRAVSAIGAAAQVVVDPRAKGPVAFALVFVRSRAEVAETAEPLVRKASPDAILWYAYPKKSSRRYRTDLSRDQGWESLAALGYRPVRQVSIDDDWSALRFREVPRVKASR